ncbi:MAG: hypothetical protein AB1600_03285 [Bacteroidota bacterium]
MPRKKMPPEYFLERIKKFYDKHHRAPRSTEFNSPFHSNVIKYFGSWASAVKEATGVELNHVRRTDEELLAPIKEHYARTQGLPSEKDLPCKSLVVSRFGSYTKAVEKAIGINIELQILSALYVLTEPVDSASAAEIEDQLRRDGLKLTHPQLRGLLGRALLRGEITGRRGDRLQLYKLTPLGKSILKQRWRMNVH